MVGSPNLPDVTMNVLGAVNTFEKWQSSTSARVLPTPQIATVAQATLSYGDSVEVTLCTTEGGRTTGEAPN
jgi:hypothetical protein